MHIFEERGNSPAVSHIGVMSRKHISRGHIPKTQQPPFSTHTPHNTHHRRKITWESISWSYMPYAVASSSCVKPFEPSRGLKTNSSSSFRADIALFCAECAECALSPPPSSRACSTASWSRFRTYAHLSNTSWLDVRVSWKSESRSLSTGMALSRSRSQVLIGCRGEGVGVRVTAVTFGLLCVGCAREWKWLYDHSDCQTTWSTRKQNPFRYLISRRSGIFCEGSRMNTLKNEINKQMQGWDLIISIILRSSD